MFRYRRYRVFLVFAVFTIFALYKFGTSSTTWREAASTAAELKNEAEDALGFGSRPRPPVAHESKKLEINIPAASQTQAPQTPPPVKKIPTPTPTPLLSRSSPVVIQKSQQKPSIPTPIRPNPHINPAPLPNELALSTSIEPIHWSKLPEKFPVPSQSLIKLPSGKPRAIPKIQFKFKPESETEKTERLAKLNKVRQVFQKSWNGYREHAWMHDELKPESGTFRDPFANWGATLVDSLDTLWIMGLKNEFEEAAKAVDRIDFTTTSRAEIPLFETTIRYLGGLIAAYDISNQKYRNLLDKAVELAEVLISAFDTPNRMPQMAFYWRPQFASQKHRAGTRVVLAEIGSLSVEFTRLAQLTGEHKYYDAVARITNNLEEFQNKTKLTGMWPVNLDASGCGRGGVSLPQKPLNVPEMLVDTPVAPSPTELLSPEGKKYVPLELPHPIVLTPNGPNPTYVAPNDGDTSTPGNSGKDAVRNWEGEPLERRQLDVDFDGSSQPDSIVGNAASAKTSTAAETLHKSQECVEQGFASTSDYGREEYTLGGMSDSTYEYLPKEYMLLGGRIEKYRTMYEQSMDVVKKHLIFRPMLPKEEDVLFCGKLHVPSNMDETKSGDLEGENAHLTCFAGGMFGMGAKIFDRPEDLEIAKKLTEGCVWSYAMTQTGIMPEAFETIPCESVKECAWNKTMYDEILDPRSDHRLESYKMEMQTYQSQLASASSWYKDQLAAMTAPPKPATDPSFPALATQTPTVADTLDKRQLADLSDGVEFEAASGVTSQDRPSILEVDPEGQPTKAQPSLDVGEVAPEPSRTLPAFPYLYSPIAPLNHEDYVQSRVKEERLPTGVTKIGARNYILRPEAIESVWYMYRITGDKHWREAGWRMFLAIDRHTSTKWGNSAIDDITKSSPTLNDEMESFWLAETLKYFFLLFETEDVVSLDEWVLNTEAHPFQRSK
ncbi:glycosyl hydrolase family 47-domain-containing protein [Phaeosphaeriaceae sp. PMI808]|nr:glycosyl hydrolase family 47-domain-containing protein [Phaeosphaeriaceae sp. PMI808]